MNKKIAIKATLILALLLGVCIGFSFLLTIMDSPEIIFEGLLLIFIWTMIYDVLNGPKNIR